MVKKTHQKKYEMRSIIYIIAAIICLLYGLFISNQNNLIVIGFMFVILADINDIKDEIEKLKKP